METVVTTPKKAANPSNFTSGASIMAQVTLEEYQTAKCAIIGYGDSNYEEKTQDLTHLGIICKQYCTAKNGAFYEVIDTNIGRIGFWSDKHNDILYYNGGRTTVEQDHPMKFTVVGATALRAPDGAFLPSVPLYMEETSAAATAQKALLQDASEMFADKMKQYIEAGGLKPRAKPGRKPQSK